MTDATTETAAHRYDFAAVEARWQAHWARHRTFAAANPGDDDFDATKPKFYVMSMFPYPSGIGLHVGHPLGYIGTDIVARYQRMCGFNVLHPMGFDAFGLPAEQFAVDRGVHPAITTRQNIDNMVAQLKRIGLSYDWDRSVCTTDADYYKWTQWVFLQLYHSFVDPADGRAKPIAELVKALENDRYYLGATGELVSAAQGMEAITGPPVGCVQWAELTADDRRDVLDGYRLAYLAEVPVNWCPALGTVLANEEVTNEGRSERGNHPVYKRPLKQWMLRITAMADRLADDLDGIDWPESVKHMQRNWVGRSEGALVDFALDGRDDLITVFTTRPDTLFGATYMVLAPEHDRVLEITTPQQRDPVNRYRAAAASKTDRDRMADAKTKTGVFTGAYAINPVNGEKIPVWIADYVLTGYGTGAIMAVPAHDDRDFEFATAFDLPIVDVVATPPIRALYGFVEQFDLNAIETLDDEQLERLVADFVGLSVNQSRHDFAEIWDIITTRRQSESDATEAGGASNARDSIASIWREALRPLERQGILPMLDSARHRSLVRSLGAAVTEPGTAINSANDEVSLDGLPTAQAKRTITDWLASKGVGRAQVQYKLRDWLFSRQRYWGEPFPILHDCETGEIVPVDASDLPVALPEMDDFSPEASDDPQAPPRPPLARAPERWRIVEKDGRRFERELNTMPQWAGSCWYYLRYLDASNDHAFVGQDAERYWMTSGSTSRDRHGAHPQKTAAELTPRDGVDLYVGGVEHAVLHLLYARFWHKVLYDLGHVSTAEPFGRLFNQGYIQAYCYRDERGIAVPASEVVNAEGKPAAEVQGKAGEKFFHDGKPVTEEYGKMGKSLKNAVAPDDVCDEYGCDTLRLYEMYLGPLDQSKPWATRDIVGVHRFLQRVWRNFVDEQTGELKVVDGLGGDVSDGRAATLDELVRLTHRTIAKVTDDMERMSFNTAIAALIEMNNALVKVERLPRQIAEPFVLMLAPLAPHLAEELWHRMGHAESLAYAPWPTFEERYLRDESAEIVVQVMGKVRGKVTVPADADRDQIEAAALADDRIAELIDGKTVRKVIVVPGKLVNIVAN